MGSNTPKTPIAHLKKPVPYEKERNEFNTTFLKLAAQKYNRYSTDDQYTSKDFDNLININTLLSENVNTAREKVIQKKMVPLKAVPYFHDKKYEVLDRKLNRILWYFKV